MASWTPHSGRQSPCLMDESMADASTRPRSDGSPGRESVCKRCGGIWAIGIGGRPAECTEKPHGFENIGGGAP